MSEAATASYGAWKSPITAESIVSNTVRFGELSLDGNQIYWLESPPREKGRGAIVKAGRNGPEDVLPAPFNARTQVHEYGGGNFIVRNGTVYFSNFEDQKIYQLQPGAEPAAVTRLEGMRYADFELSPNGKFLFCVREDHNGRSEPVNTIVRITLTDGAESVIAQGNDFYSSPRLSPDGNKILWHTWNHPDMPWDQSELWTAELEGTETRNAKKIAGGPRESIIQPEWGQNGEIYFVSDMTDWWNLYMWKKGQVVSLLPMEAEFGLPSWVFGRKWYQQIPGASKIIFIFNQNGLMQLGLLDIETKKYNLLKTPFTMISCLQVGQDAVFLLGGSPTRPSAIARLCLSSMECKVLRWAQDAFFDPKYLSIPTNIAFPTENGKEAYAWYYPPKNDDFQPPDGELPPLLVKSHGGPTGQVFSSLNPAIQYWTSRGFAVLDVNYGGSSGYGREYRERLYGNWGVVDVDDCCNGATFLVEKKLADPNRLAIDGGSAGGYTTLSALTFRKIFQAGASLYGVSDTVALACDTHKFESRYMDKLIGPYPEKKELYRKRSPIHHTEKLDCPIILLQGLEDKVVPPSQAETMFEALKEKGIPTAYIVFEKEQHGFRMAENIVKALESEFYFFSQVFHFRPADPIDPIHIENLEAMKP